MYRDIEEITISVDLPERVSAILRHTLSLLENHFYVQFKYGPSGRLLATTGSGADIRVSEKFIYALEKQEFDHQSLFREVPLIFCDDGTPDFLGTSAYMVNFLQEYIDDPECFDELDRFKYEKSYQYRFKCITENLVLKYLLQLKSNCSKLEHLIRKHVPSQLWVSHDIDYLYHSIWPDLKTAIRRLRFDQIFHLLFSRDKKKPDQIIFEKILSIHANNGLTSTFFWLANRDIFKTRSGQKIENANYDIESSLVQDLIGAVKDAGCDLGVHQSLGCKDIIAECKQIDPGITINRNHYLAGRLPDLWKKLEEGSIARDATAGFSAVMGFRNSYGSPFKPFDVIRNQPFNIEVYPLHIMDATFINQQYNPHQAKKEIIDFLEKNKTDCTISLLWHNNYFSEVKFGAWIDVYEEVLQYARVLNYQ